MSVEIKKIRFFLTISELCNIIIGMDMIKKAIKSELKRRGWTCYRLSKELKDKLSQRTVYSYLSNERDISAKRASKILEALGLKIKR